jgi:AcrR family transcriptional regulator
VLGAAVRLADRDGIQALSMRRLAQDLRVEAMTLYHYVANKDELLEGMTAEILREIALPRSGRAWKTEIRRTALSAHEVLLRHPWATSRMMTGGLTPERLAYMESILGCFREGGFTAYQAHLGYHAIESHVVGFTLWLAGMALPDDLSGLATQVLSTVSADANPYFVEHIHEHLRPRRRGDVGAYEFGLDLVLDGLERLLPTSAEG